MTAVSGSRAGIWGALEREIAAPSVQEEDRPRFWTVLSKLADIGEFRPKLADDVEIKEFHVRYGEDYAIVANPRDLLHYELKPNEAAWVRLMDGTRTVREILVQQLEDTGELELGGIADLVRSLHVGNFLDRRFIDVDEAVAKAMKPVSEARKRARTFASTLTIEWKTAERPIRAAYESVLKYAFTLPAQIVMAVVVLLGLAAFLRVVSFHRFSLSGKSLAFAFLVLFVLNWSLTLMHEMGHALVLLHYGRRVKSAGFMIYFGSLALFIESADGLMLEPRQQALQAFAGGYTEMFFCGIASIVLWASPSTWLAPTLYKFAVLGYLVMFLNWIPLLELDGYFMISDLIQSHDLRPRSLSFVRHDLLHKIRHRQGLTRQELGLALYGIAGVAFSVYVLYLSFFFWRQIFGGLVAGLWRQGIVTQILLIALALVVLGPLIRGLVSLLRAIGRRANALWERIRFRFEQSWRIEAAELIDALPLFDDLPEEVLSDLAGRVNLRTYAFGQPVVRQGERATAFYVVRKGTLQVVEQNPHTGDEKALRVLGRGEAFGEFGLAEAAPRTATVRGLEECQVFEIDKGTFDRLLSDMVQIPSFAPSVQQAMELRDLSCFAHLEPDELVGLLERGRWMNVAPGEHIIEEGAEGDAFYAIRSGWVDVIKRGELKRKMGAGSYFGEIALLLNVPRTATVIASTPVRLFRLEREGFDRLVREAFKKGTLNPVITPDTVWKH